MRYWICVAAWRPKVDVFLELLDGVDHADRAPLVGVQIELFDHASRASRGSIKSLP